MSKYVKYISSDHFGAPVIKGDMWGYCFKMLKATLVDGFNQRTDLTMIEVLDKDTFKATFGTAHNYVANQTIKISDAPYSELNGDAFVTSSTSTTVTCSSYNDLTALIGQIVTGVFKSIVAPLGFRLKWGETNRGVFVPDEIDEKAFFYIDDRDPTDNVTDWKNASGNTNYTCPLVFMTDKMSDIDTVTGRYIFPYDTANPENYKKRNYKYTTVSSTQIPANGILNFMSFGINSSSNYPNTAANQLVPIKWTVIGNGRMFYFIPQITTGNTTYNGIKDIIHGFGKTNNYESDKLSPYILIASGYSVNVGNGCFTNERVYYNGGALPLSNTASVTNFYPQDSGTTQWGILKCKSNTAHVRFYPSILPNNTNVNISNAGSMTYPDELSKKFFISSIKMTANDSYIGNLAGLVWTHNANSSFMPNRSVLKFNFKNKNKFMYICSGPFNIGNPHNLTNPTVSIFIYGLSLDYNDWSNYD